MWGRSPLLTAFPLWMCWGSVAAFGEPQICYVLDGILFLYGVVLTALYCRLKLCNAREEKEAKTKSMPEEGIYKDLMPHTQDTYETIGMKK
ncbi:high affinity immunoglobulin epsilon receptor subunit gamma [Myripristis murdjan]|uniref:high affinity immunoglobulin epsilon receptor subunit gamma n=1 Tax=Myripristis murdjan TaxID=586833 RepID=UPI0011760FBA|nr:high affinity immunoglobulin epsilon receptor subunit gamma-like [Myripristis murdjan]